MALVYLFNKSHVSRRIVKWLLLFLKYDFTIVYKPCKTHVIGDALSRLPDIIEPTSVPDQTTNVSLFYTQPKWLKVVKEFLKTKKIKSMLSIQQK
jgi:hypothetical protein